MKHNSIKSETYFNPTHIYSIFSRIHVFQGPNFFRQYFSRSGFSGSRFIRVWVQGPGPGLRSSTLYLHGNHSSASRCSPVSLLHISEHLFTRTPLKDCFCKIWFLCFCITSLALRITLALIFFHYLIRRSSHLEIFYKEAVLHLYSKVSWRNSSFSSVVCSKLTNLLNWVSSHVFSIILAM